MDLKNECVLFTPFSLKKVMTHFSDFDEIEIFPDFGSTGKDILPPKTLKVVKSFSSNKIVRLNRLQNQRFKD